MDENTRMVILIDPLNPLGSSYTEDELKEFAEIAKENDLYLLHDITYKDFARNHFLVENYAPGQTLTIYSFSKIFGMAGLRVGGVVSSKPIIKSIKNAVVNDLGVNIISQYGAIAGLKSKDQWFDKIRETCFENQRAVLGFFIGAFLLLFVAVVYGYMIEHVPVAGGEYAYAYSGFGPTCAFICGWALVLGYVVIIAINISALALLVRFLFPGVFEFGKL